MRKIMLILITILVLVLCFELYVLFASKNIFGKDLTDKSESENLGTQASDLSLKESEYNVEIGTETSGNKTTTPTPGQSSAEEGADATLTTQETISSTLSPETLPPETIPETTASTDIGSGLEENEGDLDYA